MSTDMDAIMSRIEDTGVLGFDHEDELGVSDKIRTNIPELDELLGGGLRCGLHCVTGGPSSYKTALLLQIAYLAAMDGREVAYITDEVSKRECWQRLAARKMQVDKLVGDGAYEVPSWASLEDAARMAIRDGDTELLERIGNAIHDVQYAQKRSDDYGKLDYAGFRKNGTVYLYYNRTTYGSLLITDMDRPNDPGCLYDSDSAYRLFCQNTRYIAGSLQEGPSGEYLDDEIQASDLIIIDAVNSLRMYQKDEKGSCRDHMPEPRARMEEIVTALDNYARSSNKAIVGVFHSNRTSTGADHHPSMGDFKETSAIEYRAVSALKLVRHDDMNWSGHPKAPFKSGERDGEAVGCFVLKSRTGRRTDRNKPLWLCCDGAHNLILPA